MKTIWKISGVLAMSLVLAGCGASRLLGGMGLGSSSPAPQAPVVRTGNNLALPPDLQLRPPGTVTETYQPNPAPARSGGNRQRGGGTCIPRAPRQRPWSRRIFMPSMAFRKPSPMARQNLKAT